MQKQTPTKKPVLTIRPTTPKPETCLHEEYYTEEWLEWVKAICSLNDAFRLTFTSTELYCSPDVLKFSVEDQSTILERVRLYRNFNEKNDPLMSHNQGFLMYEDTPIIWTIYYHEEDQNQSQILNPVAIDITKRHMMIMTASEWWKKLPENIF